MSQKRHEVDPESVIFSLVAIKEADPESAIFSLVNVKRNRTNFVKGDDIYTHYIARKKEVLSFL